MIREILKEPDPEVIRSGRNQIRKGAAPKESNPNISGEDFKASLIEHGYTLDPEKDFINISGSIEKLPEEIAAKCN